MNLLNKISRKVRDYGGRLYIVGGAVRDKVLGKELQDYDCEVHGLPIDKLEEILSHFGGVKAFGKSFGILELDGLEFSIPRTEVKSGESHTDFEVKLNPELGLYEAASRRDFTINALAYDPLTEEIIDTHNGLADLQNKVLRATSERFAEDPLRVLRGMQFCGRFDLDADPKTIEMCRLLVDQYSTISIERVWHEWEKLLLLSAKPSKGIKFLREVGWLPPQIEALIGVQQNPKHHPEGDVFNHTLHVLDCAADREGDKSLVVRMAALCHDMGKPYKTKVKDGKLISYGHEHLTEPAVKFMESINTPHWFVKKVIPLIENHMIKSSLTRKAALKLIGRLHPATVEEWVGLIEADCKGRPPIPYEEPPCIREVLKYSKEENFQQGKISLPITGDDLIQTFDREPGPWIGEMMSRLREAYIRGEVKTVEECLKYCSRRNEC